MCLLFDFALAQALGTLTDTLTDIENKDHVETGLEKEATEKITKSQHFHSNSPHHVVIDKAMRPFRFRAAQWDI